MLFLRPMNQQRSHRNHLLTSLFIGAVLLSCAVGAIFIGVMDIPVKVVWAALLQRLHWATSVIVPNHFALAIWQLRLPRIVMSLLAGAALALCGCVFQSIFRNPICDPYILGISSGASLGATIAIILGWNNFLFGITLPALVTSILTLLFIIGIARIRGQRSTQTLLLTGIALNFFISSLITLIMVIKQEEMVEILFWTMGSLASTTWTEIAWVFPTLIIVSSILFFYSKDLNIMQLGRESAQSLGVNTQRTTMITLIASSLLIGVVVSFSGVIGFIGLIVPHICRLMFGSNNRYLFIYSMLFGALFLLFADTLARTIAAPAELPVGSITALAGAPYFVYLLLKKEN